MSDTTRRQFLRYGAGAAVPSDKDAPFELGADGPRSILVGIDDSTTAARAGWYAAGLARRQGARVTAVFVARLPLGPAADGGAAPGGFPWEAAEEARRGVEEIFQETGRSDHLHRRQRRPIH